jgi:RND superfamily putative drug exporter
MRLLGRWNWWAPRPLLRVWDRFGIREVSELGEPAGEPVRAPAVV